MLKIHRISTTRPGYTACGKPTPRIGTTDGLCKQCYPSQPRFKSSNLSSSLPASTRLQAEFNELAEQMKRKLEGES